MFDFTLNTYIKLLGSLKNQEYIFKTYAGFVKNPAPYAIMLRHDVDANNKNSLKTAKIEKELGIQGTYYFRMVPGSYDEQIIKQIYDLGHEIGYHYEDLSLYAARGKLQGVWGRGLGAQSAGLRAQSTGQNSSAPLLGGVGGGFNSKQKESLDEEVLIKNAIESFSENLTKLRQVVPVETICMHGSPLSRWDNRLLWKYYDYREFGIIGEPYFDLDFNEVLYLTDTGRRWDGESVSIRDKAVNNQKEMCIEREVGKGRRGEREKGGEEKLNNTFGASHAVNFIPSFHSTFDIINAADSGTLPDKIMITVHPQRWNDLAVPWVREFVWQNVKNVAKRVITGMQR